MGGGRKASGAVGDFFQRGLKFFNLIGRLVGVRDGKNLNDTKNGGLKTINLSSFSRRKWS